MCWQDFSLQIMANSWPYFSQMRQVHSHSKQGTISAVKLERKCPGQDLLHCPCSGVLLLSEWNCTSLKQSFLVLLWWYLLKSRPRTAGSETSLVVQWLRIHLPMKRMQVWSLVRKLRSFGCKATKPVCHNWRSGNHIEEPTQSNEDPVNQKKKKERSKLRKFFWSCQVACRILIPWPGIEPMPPRSESAES